MLTSDHHFPSCRYLFVCFGIAVLRCIRVCFCRLAIWGTPERCCHNFPLFVLCSHRKEFSLFPRCSVPILSACGVVLGVHSGFNQILPVLILCSSRCHIPILRKAQCRVFGAACPCAFKMSKSNCCYRHAIDPVMFREERAKSAHVTP